jgi:hypothetical protein
MPAPKATNNVAINPSIGSPPFGTALAVSRTAIKVDVSGWLRDSGEIVSIHRPVKR